ncbi:hypothetical protein PG993_003052 [Apiospora rasikravindrae]|uniref:Uncharacterized protein n=1 Tax=Apiospora rasikravindrae TaxID=990691 RepID=A0ABR1TYV0_9PEZI
MAEAPTHGDLPLSSSSPLSPLDWLMPRTYIRQMLCFSASPSTSSSPAASRNIPGESEVAQTLRDGLAATAAEVPCLLSRVVGLTYPHGAVGLSRPYQSIEDMFDVRDVSQDYSFTELKEKGFPPDVLGRGGFTPETSQSDEEPVFRARLSLVEGGFVLGIAVHHSTTDITGFGVLLKTWAADCRRLRDRSENWSDLHLIDAAMLDRAAVRDLGSGVAGSDIPSTIPTVLFFRDGEPVPKPAAVAPPSGFATAVFYFSPASLGLLKALATDRLLSVAADVPWVSTSDVLTALLWSAVVAAEAPPLPLLDGDDKTTSISTISIPVNFRGRCDPPLSPEYLGAAFARAAASAPVRELVSMAALSSAADGDGPQRHRADTTADTLLAKAAATIRRAIRDQVDGQSIRAAVAYTAAQPDITRVKRRPADGISMVSWADQGLCALDWGPHVGRCETVRLGKMPGRRYPIVLPRLADGGLEVILSLEAAAMERFRGGALVRRFGELRCLA